MLLRFSISLFSLLLLASPALSDPGAHVLAARGEVQQAGHLLHPGDAIAAGVELTIGSKDSELDVQFSSGDVVRLKSNTRAKLNFGTSAPEVVLLLGKAFVHVRKSPIAQKPIHPVFYLRSRSAVAGVRGTEFMAEEDEKKGTYFCVCEGTIEVRKANEAENIRPTLVSSGQDLYAKPGLKLGSAVDSPMMAQMTADEFKSFPR